MTGLGTHLALLVLGAAAAWPAYGQVLAPTPEWKGPTVPKWRAADEIDMTGVIENGRFRPLSIAVPATSAPASPALVPMGDNMLPLATHRTFGVETRVAAAASDNGLVITCKAGDAPAGVVVGWPGYRLPTGYVGRWRITGSGASLGISAVRPNADAPVEPQARLIGGTASLPLDTRRRELVLVCPRQSVTAHITGIAIVPDRGAADPLPRGTWVWRDTLWRDDPALFAETVARAGLTELAVQAPAEPGPPLDRLAHALAERGLAMRLVDGDPAMATPVGLAPAIARVTALRRWCDRAAAPERPRLELDIEPYGRADFAQDQAAGWRGWADAVRAIAGAWGEPVSVDLPWWMYRTPAGTAALARAGNAIADIVVMAYRTDPQLIVDAAAPWLADGRWPVRIAIETGPVASEATRRYRRARSGTLRLDDNGAALFDAPVDATRQAALFALVSQTVTDPARVSVHGDPRRAGAVEHAIVPVLAGWPQFRGWRVHGWEPPVEPS